MPAPPFALLLRRRLSSAVLLLAVPTLAAAQVTANRVRHYDELIWKQPYYRGPLKYGWSIGRAWYQGDLTDGLRGAKARTSLGVALSGTVWPNLEVGFDVQYIRLTARQDQVADRGYRFLTRLVEGTVVGRYYIERYQFDPALDSRDQGRSRWYRPFVVAGVGQALWWATTTGGPATLGPDSVANVSEQRYPAYTTVVPVGAGVGLRFSSQTWLAPELTYRFTFSDNLDDVGARRGNPKKNDGYWQFAVRFQYQPPRSRGKRLR